MMKHNLKKIPLMGVLMAFCFGSALAESEKQVPTRAYQADASELEIKDDMTQLRKQLEGIVPARCMEKYIGIAGFLIRGRKGRLSHVYDDDVEGGQPITTTFITFAPGQVEQDSLTLSRDEACSMSYEYIVRWSKSCREVEQSAGLKKAAAPLNSRVSMVQLSPKQSILFIPLAENSCLSVQKEMLF